MWVVIIVKINNVHFDLLAASETVLNPFNHAKLLTRFQFIELHDNYKTCKHQL